MGDLTRQQPMRIRLFRIHSHGRLIILTAFMVIVFVSNGCDGDQTERDQRDIVSGTSQVQFEKHQRKALNFNLTLDDNALLRDETIKSDDKAEAHPLPSSTIIAHDLMNKSKGRAERNGRETTSAVKIRTNKPFDPKRDQHRNGLSLSRNINGNALDPSKQTENRQSDVSVRGRYFLTTRPLERVPDSKPKIASKQFASTSFDRSKTYLTYNLVGHNARNTNQFQATPYQPSYNNATRIKQTSKSFVYKSYYRPPQRNNCDKCRIVPGAPIRHKQYYPTRVLNHGTYLTIDTSTQQIIT